MSNIYLPSLSNKKTKKNKFLNKSKNILNNDRLGFRNNLLENNYANTFSHNPFKKSTYTKSVNNNKKIKINLKENIPNNSIKAKNHLKHFWKNRTYLDLENNKNFNKKLNLLLINKSCNYIDFDNNEFKNKNYNNFSIDYNEDSNFVDNNLKYLPSNIYKNKEPINLYYSYNKSNNNSKNKKISRTIKVNKIVNSLINSSDEEFKNKIIIKEDKFPKEKSVDPFSYIKYNIQKNPYDKAIYKGINTIINQIGKDNLREEYENNLIQKANDANNLKIDSNNFKAPLGEAKIYKRKYEDMINQTKIYKSFYFNKNENPKNKIKRKFYNPHYNILEETYKIYFNKKFKFALENKNNKIERNKTKTDISFENKIDKYLSFDSRINNILFISKNTEDNINKKSREHEKMLNKFNFMFNSYLK